MEVAVLETDVKLMVLRTLARVMWTLTCLGGSFTP